MPKDVYAKMLPAIELVTAKILKRTQMSVGNGKLYLVHPYKEILGIKI